MAKNKKCKPLINDKNCEAFLLAFADVGNRAIEYEKLGLKFNKEEPRSLTSYFNAQYKKYLKGD